MKLFSFCVRLGRNGEKSSNSSILGAHEKNQVCNAGWKETRTGPNGFGFFPYSSGRRIRSFLQVNIPQKPGSKYQIVHGTCWPGIFWAGSCSNWYKDLNRKAPIRCFLSGGHQKWSGIFDLALMGTFWSSLKPERFLGFVGYVCRIEIKFRVLFLFLCLYYYIWDLFLAQHLFVNVGCCKSLWNVLPQTADCEENQLPWMSYRQHIYRWTFLPGVVKPTNHKGLLNCGTNSRSLINVLKAQSLRLKQKPTI